MGLQMISRLDSLIDGLNMEISQIMTLVRRPAFPRFSSVAFGSSDYPLNFYSFQNTTGTLFNLVDTPTQVYSFSANTNAAILTKGGSGRGDFYRIGDNVYYCNGTDTKFWNGSTWANWGITAPANAPTIANVGGSLSPQSGYTWGYCYVNTNTGQVSAMSPASTNSGCVTSQNFNVTYAASADPQVNAIWIFRIQDGGGVYYFLTSVANTSSTYADSTADSGLNTFIRAPLSPNNSPCPSGSSLITFFDGRPWVASKNIVYWAQGPQTTTGLGEQSFNTSTNFFKLPINITGFAPTSNGLLIFTSDITWIVTGTGGVYFINPWQKNFGIEQANAVTQDGDLIFVYTSRGQLFQIGNSLQEIGLNIRAKLAAFNPRSVSLAIHRSGTDEGLFVSDGASNVFRYSMTFTAWSPVAQPVQGAGVLASIETSTANWTLLMGGTTGAKYIWGRNTASWTDDGGTYSCYATVGNLIIGGPGSKNIVEFIALDSAKTGTYPTVGILTNEISGSFTNLPNPVPDPPQLPANKSYNSFRHWLKAGNPTVAQQIESMQIKVSFIAENVASEIFTLGVN